MGIHKRPGSNNYHVDFIWSGKRYQKSTKTSNKVEARKIEAAMKVSLAQGRWGLLSKDPAPTLREFMPSFLLHVRTHCAKARTVEFYGQQANALLAFERMAKERLDVIDTGLINEFIQFRSSSIALNRKRIVAKSTVNRALATLRKLMGLAYERKLIDRIPAVTRLSGEKPRDYVVSREIEKAYLSFAAQPLCDIATLLIDSGLRSGEALNLRWTDVDEPTAVSPGRVNVKEGKSCNARRSVPLTERAAAMLQRRRETASSEWVFASAEGTRLRESTVSHWHGKVRAKLNLHPEFVLHSLRHTFLTRLGETTDAFTLRKLAGHYSVTVSERYVHPSTEAMDAAIERLTKMVADPQSDVPRA